MYHVPPSASLTTYETKLNVFCAKHCVLLEFNKYIPVDVCFVQNSFQTIIKLEECVVLDGK